MIEEPTRPAFYAARPGRLRDWWTLLHPPYTAWHLSYVVVGACLAPTVALSKLLATLLAFFVAVGVAAHAYDELQGRPLGTGIPARHLVTACAAGLAGALVLGVFGVLDVGLVLVPFLVVGPLLVVAYNAEFLGGAFHTDVGFALAWGAFPVLTAYAAQAGALSFGAVLAAAAAAALSLAQRALSTPARHLRRRVVEVSGAAVLGDGSEERLERSGLLAPLERGLRTLTWATVLLASALAVFRLG
ncbi:MAG: hypothetical protein ACRDV8_10305 [Acidimicrobiales bacterium]